MPETRFCITAIGTAFRSSDTIMPYVKQQALGNGCDYAEVASATTEEEVIAAAREADGLLFRTGVPPSRRIFESLPRCKIMASMGVGFAGDWKAATRNNTIVTNVPDVCINVVAEQTMAHLLATQRGIAMMDRKLRAGLPWEKVKKLEYTLPQLSENTLGLIGFGRIARAVAVRAKVFGMRILAYSPSLDERTAFAHGVQLASIDEILERSDIVSLHCPLTEQTKGLIGEEEFRRMKPRAILINTTRGEVVDREALLRALRENWILAASLDAPPGEPLKPGDPLLELDNVLISPHAGGGFDRLHFDSTNSALQGILEVARGRLPRLESILNPEVLKTLPQAQ